MEFKIDLIAAAKRTHEIDDVSGMESTATAPVTESKVNRPLETEPVSTSDQIVTCLGCRCPHVKYKSENDSICLWCALLDQMVLNIQVCPDERGSCWEKDATGFPLPGFDVENF